MKVIDQLRARWRGAERNFVPTPREQIMINIIGWMIALFVLRQLVSWRSGT
jgi:hypothetical protein